MAGSTGARGRTRSTQSARTSGSGGSSIRSNTRKGNPDPPAPKKMGRVVAGRTGPGYNRTASKRTDQALG